MSKNKELADYIMDQLSDLEEVRNIPMMGGHIFYYKELIPFISLLTVLSQVKFLALNFPFSMS